MGIVVIIIIALVLYFALHKPYADSQDKAGAQAAELSKYFGNVKIDAVQIDGASDSDIFRVYVIFEEDGYINPSKRYKIVETSYRSESDNERYKKADYARAVLRKMPYGLTDYSGSAYTWDKYKRYRENGTLML